MDEVILSYTNTKGLIEVFFSRFFLTRSNDKGLSFKSIITSGLSHTNPQTWCFSELWINNKKVLIPSIIEFIESGKSKDEKMFTLKVIPATRQAEYSDLEFDFEGVMDGDCGRIIKRACCS